MNIVILAAGASSRMRQDKALLPFAGTTWIEWQLGRLPKHANVVVVRQAADPDFVRRCGTASIVYNPNIASGSFRSLQIGLGSIPAGEPAFVLPIDAPAPTLDVWKTLHHHYDLPSHEPAVVPSHQQRTGHPIGLSPGLITRLLSLDMDHEDSRLDRQTKHQRRVIEVNDPLVCLNLNTPELFLEFSEAFANAK